MLTEEVVPYVEHELLGFGSSVQPRRAILGCSYTAVVALQVLLTYPKAFNEYLLGSPSVCFDPEILLDVELGDYQLQAVEKGVACLVMLGALESEGRSLPGNVHDQMTATTKVFAENLRKRGITVEGAEEIPGEDHTTMKLPFVSRALTWFASRASP